MEAEAPAKCSRQKGGVSLLHNVISKYLEANIVLGALKSDP
jgi:hypothetical protein